MKSLFLFGWGPFFIPDAETSLLFPSVYLLFLLVWLPFPNKKDESENEKRNGRHEKR